MKFKLFTIFLLFVNFLKGQHTNISDCILFQDTFVLSDTKYDNYTGMLGFGRNVQIYCVDSIILKRIENCQNDKNKILKGKELINYDFVLNRFGESISPFELFIIKFNNVDYKFNPIRTEFVLPREILNQKNNILYIRELIPNAFDSFYKSYIRLEVIDINNGISTYYLDRMIINLTSIKNKLSADIQELNIKIGNNYGDELAIKFISY